MSSFFLWLHVAFGFLFIIFVLIQDKGTGLSATFGGTGGFYATQRGAAKVMHVMTIVFAIIFVLTALLSMISSSFFSLSSPSASSSAVTIDDKNVKVETEPAKK